MSFRCVAGLAASVIAWAPVVAQPTEKLSKQERSLLAMTPEQFRASANLRDDSLETMATITTEAGFQQKDGLLKLVNADHFFRAFIDKKSGAANFQVYKFTRYYGGSWLFQKLVNFETASGPVAKELDVIARDVGDCSQLLGCLHVETVAFSIEEELVRWIASRYAPGQEAASRWRFRIKAQAGTQSDHYFTAAEAAGLLLAVDAYRAQHKLANKGAIESGALGNKTDLLPQK